LAIFPASIVPSCFPPQSSRAGGQCSKRVVLGQSTVKEASDFFGSSSCQPKVVTRSRGLAEQRGIFRRPSHARNGRRDLPQSSSPGSFGVGKFTGTTKSRPFALIRSD
jgi:hypothetical protein